MRPNWDSCYDRLVISRRRTRIRRNLNGRTCRWRRSDDFVQKLRSLDGLDRSANLKVQRVSWIGWLSGCIRSSNLIKTVFSFVVRKNWIFEDQRRAFAGLIRNQNWSRRKDFIARSGSKKKKTFVE